MNMRQAISYLELAREAKSRGDIKGVWRAFKQHRRVMQKQRATMAGTVAAQVKN